LINLHNFRILVDKPSSSGITIINRKKWLEYYQLLDMG
jgi:hypothetical protein